MYQVEMIIIDSTMDTAELSTWKGVKMTERLQALGYVSLKSNGVHGGGIEGLDNYQGILIKKNLEQYIMLLYIFLKGGGDTKPKDQERFFAFRVCVCVGWRGGDCLFFEALLVFEINHKR